MAVAGLRLRLSLFVQTLTTIRKERVSGMLSSIQLCHIVLIETLRVVKCRVFKPTSAVRMKCKFLILDSGRDADLRLGGAQHIDNLLSDVFISPNPKVDHTHVLRLSPAALVYYFFS